MAKKAKEVDDPIDDDENEGWVEDVQAEDAAIAAKSEPEEPDTLAKLLHDWFQFDSERIHRERHMQPGDSTRMSALVARLRALKI